MTLSRRFVLASGASLSVLALAGCNPGSETEAETAAADAESTSTTPAASGNETGGAMLDGSPIEPVSSPPIMNVKGVKDRPIGGADADVTVIEYASPTCPHCAAFHVNTYPGLKEEYIETGKIRFIVRPFLRNVLDAVVFMLAEAAGADGYYNVIETYFKTQNQWAMAEKPRDAIQEIALQLGFTEESFEAALTNQELFDGMEVAREQALDEFDLTGTPTFYINGNKLSGEQSLEAFREQIDPLLG